MLVSWCGASDIVTDFLVQSKLVDAQNVSCLGFLVEIFVQKTMLIMEWILSTLSCQYLCDK